MNSNEPRPCDCWLGVDMCYCVRTASDTGRGGLDHQNKTVPKPHFRQGFFAAIFQGDGGLL